LADGRQAGAQRNLVRGSARRYEKEVTVSLKHAGRILWNTASAFYNRNELLPRSCGCKSTFEFGRLERVFLRLQIDF